MYILAMVTPTSRKMRMRCSSFSGLLSVTVVTAMINMQEIATTVSMRATDDRTRSLFRALNMASLGMIAKEWKKLVRTDSNDKAAVF